jgi:hypothetical protein
VRKRELLDRVSIDSRVIAGQPCIRGTRLTAHHILNILVFGMSVEDIAPCLLFASEALATPLGSPLPPGVTPGSVD